MAAFFRWLREINVAAFAVLVVLFLALLLEGANSAARASLLSAAMIGVLLVAAAVTPRADLASVLRANALSVLAALAFVTWCLATAIPHLDLGLSPNPLWTNAGAPLSLSPYRTIEGVTAFLGPASAYLLGALLAPDARARDWLGRWLILMAIVYALIGLYAFFAGFGPGGPRLDVGIGSANAAATLFGMLALAATVLLVRAGRGRLDKQGSHVPSAWRWLEFAFRAPLSLAAFMILIACLLLTASRGGLFATLAAFVIFAAALAAQSFKHESVRRGALFAPIVVVALLFAFIFLRGGDEVLARFATAADDMEIRRTLAAAHWRQYLAHPVSGSGLNTYYELNTLAATPDNWNALRAPGSAHNIFIQALEETGLIGLGLWILMLAPPLMRGFARVAAGKSGVEWAAFALAATSLVLLHGTVDFGLQVPAIAALFAFTLGASVGRPNQGGYGRRQ